MANIIEIILQARDLASAQIKKMTTSIRGAGAAGTKAGKGLGSLKGQVSGIGTEITRVAPRLGQLTGALRSPIIAATAAVIGLGLALRSIVSAAAGFQKAMTEVATLVDTSAVNMQILDEGVLKLSKKLGETPVGLSKGLFQVISAGISAADALDVLEIGAKTAIAAVTDTKTATTGLLKVVNAFGKEALGAKTQLDAFRKVSDLFFQTNKFGVLTVAELSDTIGRVAPTAKEAGITIEELLAAIAALTKGGLKTDEAITALLGAINGVVKPGQAVAKQMKDLGIEFDLAAAPGNKLKKILDSFADIAKRDKGLLVSLVENRRARTAILSLTGSQLESFNNILLEMANASGAADVALEKQAKTFDFASKRFEAAMEVMKISLGRKFLPVFTTLLTKLTAFINLITEDIPTAIANWEQGLKKGDKAAGFFTREVREANLEITTLKGILKQPFLPQFVLLKLKGITKEEAIQKIKDLELLLVQLARGRLKELEIEFNAKVPTTKEITDKVKPKPEIEVALAIDPKSLKQFQNLKAAIEQVGPAPTAFEALDAEIKVLEARLKKLKETEPEKGKGPVPPEQIAELERLITARRLVAAEDIRLTRQIISAEIAQQQGAAIRLRAEQEILRARGDKTLIDQAKKREEAALREAGLSKVALQLKKEQFVLEKQIADLKIAEAGAEDEFKDALAAELIDAGRLLAINEARQAADADRNFALAETLVFIDKETQLQKILLQQTEETTEAIKDQLNELSELMQQVAQNMRSALGDTFFKFFKEGVFDMRSVWEAVWDTMLRKASDTLADLVTDTLFSLDNIKGAFAGAGGPGGTGGILGLLGGIFPGLAQTGAGGGGSIFDIIGRIFGGGGGGGAALPIPTPLQLSGPFAKGGIVKRPTLALIGEAGPEAVVPLTRPPRSDVAQRLGITTAQRGIVADDLFTALSQGQDIASVGLSPQELFDVISSGQEIGIEKAFDKILGGARGTAGEADRAFEFQNILGAVTAAVGEADRAFGFENILGSMRGAAGETDRAFEFQDILGVAGAAAGEADMAFAFQNILRLGETAGATERAFANVGATEEAFGQILDLGDTAGATENAFASILSSISGAGGGGGFGGIFSGLFGILKSILPFAKGGIVNRPTLALIGEAGPEAVVPLGIRRAQRGLISGGEGGRRLPFPFPGALEFLAEEQEGGTGAGVRGFAGIGRTLTGRGGRGGGAVGDGATFGDFLDALNRASPFGGLLTGLFNLARGSVLEGRLLSSFPQFTGGTIGGQFFEGSQTSGPGTGPVVGGGAVAPTAATATPRAGGLVDVFPGALAFQTAGAPGVATGFADIGRAVTGGTRTIPFPGLEGALGLQVPAFKRGAIVGKAGRGNPFPFPSSEKFSFPSLQAGGIVRKPSLILAGEGGPEAVVPLTGQPEKEEPTESVIINLFDRRELESLVAQQMAANKGVLVNDVLQGLRGNQPIRRAGRKFL